MIVNFTILFPNGNIPTHILLLGLQSPLLVSGQWLFSVHSVRKARIFFTIVYGFKYLYHHSNNLLYRVLNFSTASTPKSNITNSTNTTLTYIVNQGLGSYCPMSWSYPKTVTFLNGGFSG